MQWTFLISRVYAVRATKPRNVEKINNTNTSFCSFAILDISFSPTIQSIRIRHCRRSLAVNTSDDEEGA